MICPDCKAELNKCYMIENGEHLSTIWICECKTPPNIIHRARQADAKTINRQDVMIRDLAVIIGELSHEVSAFIGLDNHKRHMDDLNRILK